MEINYRKKRAGGNSDVNLFEEFQDNMDELVLELIYSERLGSETREYWVVQHGEWQGYGTRDEQREKLEMGCPKLGDGNL